MVGLDYVQLADLFFLMGPAVPLRYFMTFHNYMCHFSQDLSKH